jgi:hypothetical protein
MKIGKMIIKSMIVFRAVIVVALKWVLGDWVAKRSGCRLPYWHSAK